MPCSISSYAPFAEMEGERLHREQRELAIIGTDNGDTHVVLFESLNDRILMEFLRRLTDHEVIPYWLHNVVWIPSGMQLAYMLIQTTGARPNRVQGSFLMALDRFLSDLYRPNPRYYRPGRLHNSDTATEQLFVVRRRVAAYLRHTRREPTDIDAWYDMFRFAFDFFRSIV